MRSGIVAEYISKQRAIDFMGCCLVSAKANYKDETSVFKKEQFKHYAEAIEAMIDVVGSVEAADVQPVKWISVKDRLPDDCVEVLVHDTDCGILIGWYDKKDSIFVAEFINELDAVTHWIPLPEPPQD